MGLFESHIARSTVPLRVNWVNYWSSSEGESEISLALSTLSHLRTVQEKLYLYFQDILWLPRREWLGHQPMLCSPSELSAGP